MLNKIRKEYIEAYKQAFNLKLNSTFYLTDYKDSFMVLAVMENNQDFDGFRTCAIYDLYKELCDSFEFNVLTKGDFSRFVNKYFGYTVVDKRIRGVKSRVFIKKAGV